VHGWFPVCGVESARRVTDASRRFSVHAAARLRGTAAAPPGGTLAPRHSCPYKAGLVRVAGTAGRFGCGRPAYTHVFTACSRGPYRAGRPGDVVNRSRIRTAAGAGDRPQRPRAPFRGLRPAGDGPAGRSVTVGAGNRFPRDRPDIP